MEKIARICWNTHDWKRPSGSEGKSLSDGSYEKKIGFGHEEWILDDSRIYEPNGYHYGFLQPMNVASGKHIGAVYDIHLFSISPLKRSTSFLSLTMSLSTVEILLLKSVISWSMRVISAVCL